MTGSGRRTEAELAAIQRDGAMCQRCGLWLAGDLDLPTSEWRNWSLHHRILRGRGTPVRIYDQVANLVVLCGSGTTGCHGWCHHERKAANTDGWTLWSGQDPTGKMMVTLYGTLIMLLGDGTKVVDQQIPLPDVEPPMRAAPVPRWMMPEPEEPAWRR